MASAERPRVSIRIHQLGRARLGGRYTKDHGTHNNIVVNVKTYLDP